MEEILEARNVEEATQQISPSVSPQSVDSGRRKGKDTRLCALSPSVAYHVKEQIFA
jgi:hypothetical protein